MAICCPGYSQQFTSYLALIVPPPSPGLVKNPVTGVYTPITWYLQAATMISPLHVIYQAPECPTHHLHRLLGNIGDTKWWRWNGGNRKEPTSPAALLTKQQSGAAITSLYDEEKTAMRMALKWILPSPEATAICTDSQSLLKVIKRGSADTSDLRRILDQRAGKTTLPWIPVHHGVADNEEAGACAKQTVAITDDTPRSVSFSAASELICQTLMDPSLSHCRTKGTKTSLWPAASTRHCPPRMPTTWSHTLLNAYANQLDTTVDPKCPSRTLAAAVSQRCSTEKTIILRTIPTALGPHHQPGQCASAC